MQSYLAMLMLVAGPISLAAQRPRMVLGDLILRNADGAVFRLGKESITLSPTGDFDRSLPIQVAYQVSSSAELLEATTTIVLIGNAGRDSLPALRIRFPSPIRAGTNTSRHELVVDRIPIGRYRMELTVVDSTSRQLIQRQTFLRLK